MSSLREIVNLGKGLLQILDQECLMGTYQLVHHTSFKGPWIIKLGLFTTWQYPYFIIQVNINSLLRTLQSIHDFRTLIVYYLICVSLSRKHSLFCPSTSPSCSLIEVQSTCILILFRTKNLVDLHPFPSLSKNRNLICCRSLIQDQEFSPLQESSLGLGIHFHQAFLFRSCLRLGFHSKFLFSFIFIHRSSRIEVQSIYLPFLFKDKSLVDL